MKDCGVFLNEQNTKKEKPLFYLWVREKPWRQVSHRGFIWWLGDEKHKGEQIWGCNALMVPTPTQGKRAAAEGRGDEKAASPVGISDPGHSDRSWRHAGLPWGHDKQWSQQSTSSVAWRSDLRLSPERSLVQGCRDRPAADIRWSCLLWEHLWEILEGGEDL